MPQSWFVLVPPCIVIILATLTRRIQFSLFMGIVAASLVINDFAVIDAARYFFLKLYHVSELNKVSSFSDFMNSSNLFICLFLVLLGILITMIRYSGAAYAYGNYVAKRITTAQGVERASLILSSFFFIDDYFSCLTVGSVMQPIADKFRVPRVKLALLVNAVAAPFAIIFPLSSWIAELVGQLRNSGVGLVHQAKHLVHADPLGMYISSIPFMFYAFTMIIGVWYMVSRRISFGIFAKHERFASKTGELFGGKMPVVHRVYDLPEDKKRSSRVLDFIFPIVLLFCSVIIWLLTQGGYALFGGSRSLIDAIQASNIFAAFFFGGLITVFVTFGVYFNRRKISKRDIWPIIKEGIQLMGGSLVMLMFIWTFSRMLSKDLQAGEYIAQLLLGRVDPYLLPLMFFALAGFTSVMIGTAWGTIGILVPLSLEMVPVFLGFTPPVLLTDVPMLSVVLGALISGAIIGMHISPIADVMLMSATSVGAYHLDLVRGQISVTVPTILASALGYLVVGLLLPTYGRAAASAGGLGVSFIGIMFFMTILHIAHAYKTSQTK